MWPLPTAASPRKLLRCSSSVRWLFTKASWWTFLWRGGFAQGDGFMQTESNLRMPSASRCWLKLPHSKRGAQ
ncbi:hypothetical protein B0J12DRAFT_654220 [Macrophomina phaseolina]|uniref:Secreted protein n=1 Tax=Macrophomina phaseolina TaxID=35725 RepID=A0ABQ8GJ69_9PEZI|nr:hypothetical protein B0J12DRAFT_654220 [Macrophomina phaseolina]